MRSLSGLGSPARTPNIDAPGIGIKMDGLGRCSFRSLQPSVTTAGDHTSGRSDSARARALHSDIASMAHDEANRPDLGWIQWLGPKKRSNMNQTNFTHWSGVHHIIELCKHAQDPTTSKHELAMSQDLFTEQRHCWTTVGRNVANLE